MLLRALRTAVPPRRRCVLPARALGLFNQPSLRRPSDFAAAPGAAVAACAPHIAALSAVGEGGSGQGPLRTPAQARDVLQRLDAVSNALCCVLDAAEACRSLAAAPSWRDGAQRAYLELAGFMHELNGHAPLYLALGRIAASAPLLAALAPEEARLVRLLRAEFERDGIARAPEVRARIGAVQGALGELCSQFAAGLQGGEGSSEGGSEGDSSALPPPQPLRTFLAPPSARAAVAALPGHLLQGAHLPPARGGALPLPASPALLHHILRASPHAGLRAAALRAHHALHAHNVPTLEAIRGARRELAALAGADSFVAMNASDRMLGSGEAAVDFLRGLARALLPRAAREARALARIKAQCLARGEGSEGEGEGEGVGEGAGQEHSPAPTAVESLRSAVCTPPLQPWDFSYYSAQARSSGGQAAPAPAPAPAAAGEEGAEEDPCDAAAAYLPLDAVLGGLGGLMLRVFGVHMQRVAFAPGEAWGPGGAGQHAGLLRYDLAHETEGALGTLYLDLLPREHKFTGAAHFVVRCGKRLHAHDGEGGAAAAAAGGGGGGGGGVQLPVVVLALSLSSPAAAATPPSGALLLSPAELETLFHEWGHATHSLLSRTQFQHTSGTRAPLDFVEVPSHLFEYWAREYESVAAFASHCHSGARLPRALWARVQAQRSAWRASELLQLTVHSLFDLALFGSEGLAARVLQGPGVSAAQAAALARACVEAEGEGEGEGSSSAALQALAAELAAGSAGASAGIDLRSEAALRAADGEPLLAAPAPTPTPTSTPTPAPLPSRQLLAAVGRRYSVLPQLASSDWAGGFAHLSHYGGGYYTYAVAAAVSAALWARLFEGRVFSRESGEVLRRELLAHGGARDPRDMLRACLGSERVGLGPLLAEVERGALAGSGGGGGSGEGR